MQTEADRRRRTTVRTPLGLLADVGEVPLALLLGLLSAFITLGVALTTLAIGHVPRSGAAGLICALLLAAIAAAEAARPVERPAGQGAEEDEAPSSSH